MRMAFLRGVAMMEVGPIAPAITTQLIPDAWGAWSKNRRKSQTCRGQSDTFRPNCGEVNFQPPLNARRNKDNGTTQLAPFLHNRSVILRGSGYNSLIRMGVGPAM
jgi:hypothetical protein